MVGAGTLQNIHKRLVEIFETDVPFAGRSVLFNGDLNQLRPVMDSLIFEAPRGRDSISDRRSCSLAKSWLLSLGEDHEAER